VSELATFNLKRIYIFSSGLCTILRSEAGGQEEAVAGGCEDDPAYRNNAHFLDDGGLSNHVGYYDALPPPSPPCLFLSWGPGSE